MRARCHEKETYMKTDISLSPMLNAYPDSMGGTLGDIVRFLSRDEVKGAFGAFYILPSLFNSDLDRGFCVVDYGLNEDGSGYVIWDDGKRIPSSVKYVHQKDEHLHKAIAEALQLPEIAFNEQ